MSTSSTAIYVHPHGLLHKAVLQSLQRHPARSYSCYRKKWKLYLQPAPEHNSRRNSYIIRCDGGHKVDFYCVRYANKWDFLSSWPMSTANQAFNALINPYGYSRTSWLMCQQALLSALRLDHNISVFEIGVQPSSTRNGPATITSGQCHKGRETNFKPNGATYLLISRPSSQLCLGRTYVIWNSIRCTVILHLSWGGEILQSSTQGNE